MIHFGDTREEQLCKLLLAFPATVLSGIPHSAFRIPHSPITRPSPR